jgi:flavodoxin I
MRILVVYDSLYGNTEKIAQAIGAALPGEVQVSRVGEADPSELSSFDLLIVGSPTHGGRPSPATRELLDKLQSSALEGINVATFDTRHSSKLTVIFGYAAGRIAGSLKKKGGTLIVSPEGFLVTGTEGPLKEGEVERAAGWAKEILESKK